MGAAGVNMAERPVSGWWGRWGGRRRSRWLWRALQPQIHELGPDRAGDNPLKRALHDEMRQGRRPAGSSRAMAVNEEEARWAIALNYGSLALIDVAVGRLTAHLARQGLADNTVIIFTSDHGDYMGDHGLLNKGPLHYRSLIRVPFIWSDPRDPEASRDERLCSSIDLGTSILARAGVPPVLGMKGLDLIQQGAQGPQASALRDAVLIEEGDANDLIEGLDAHRACVHA